MKNNEYLKLIGYVLLTFVAVWILALISNKFFGIEINSDTAIISFIGIIATFIVVGNYSQVSEMRNQALEQTKSYNSKIDEFNTKIAEFNSKIAEFNSKLAEIEEIKQKLRIKEEDIENLQTEFYDSQFDNNMFLAMQYHMINQHGISFYLFNMSFEYLTKIKYQPEAIEVINYLIESIRMADNLVYTKEVANKLIYTAAKAKNIEGIDVIKIDELLEVIKTKNAELGYDKN